jgi:hypothetical protein
MLDYILGGVVLQTLVSEMSAERFAQFSLTRCGRDQLRQVIPFWGEHL